MSTNTSKTMIINKDTESCSLCFVVRTGPALEKESESGYSHFLEHVLFRQSTANPDPGGVEKKLDELGVSFKARTDKERTVYIFTFHKDVADNFISFINEAVSQPLFTDELIEKQKEVVLDELRLDEFGTAEDKFYEQVDKLVFGKSELGKDVMGTKDTITGINKKKIKAFFDKTYTKSNSFIVYVGPGISKKSREIIDNVFDLPEGDNPQEPVADLSLATTGRKEIKLKENQEFISWVFKQGVKSIEEKLTFKILSIVMNTKLDHELFADNIVEPYSHGVSLTMFEKTGIIDAWFSFEKNTEEILSKTETFIKNLSVDGRDLKRAKNIALTDLAITNDSPALLAEHLVVINLYNGDNGPVSIDVEKRIIKDLSLADTSQKLSELIIADNCLFYTQ